MSASELILEPVSSSRLERSAPDLGAPPAPTGVEGMADYVTDFELWVRQHAVALRRTAFLLTGDHQLAEDLVQSALVKVVPRWSRVVASGDPWPYVRTVLVRTAVGWRRRRWTGEVPTDELPAAAAADFTGGVVDRAAMMTWLRELPPRQRAVIVLRFYQDLTEAQSAAVLGVSVGTVKSHTARALARLEGTIERPRPAGSPEPGDQQ